MNGFGPTIMSRPSCDDYVDLPDQMRHAKRWLVWKSIPQGEGKKPRKIPFYVNSNPRGGELDSAADLANLATFDDALAALQTGKYAGLGFALGPDETGNFWQGIDLDDVPNRPDLQQLADDLPGYTEKSPSGTGMHAVGYGTAFDPLGSNDTGIEAYSAGRFFTVTCDSAGLHPPIDLRTFVEERLRPAHRRAFQNKSTPEGVQVETVDPRTVNELRSALLSMRSDDRDLWVQMGHALKTLGDVGRGIWLNWAATSEKYDPTDAAKKWESFKPTRSGYQVVFAEAQRRGWVNPRSNAATGEAERDFSVPSWATPTADHDRYSKISHVPEIRFTDFLVGLDETVSADSLHPHIVAKWVPEGEVTLLAGHGGVGKSYIALLLAISVALGLPFGGLTTTRRRVLFYSGEDNKEDLLRRVAKICRSLGIDQHELNGWLFPFDLSDVQPTLFRFGQGSAGPQTPTATSWLNQLESFVKENDIGLTIIDNASDVFDGNEIVRTQVRAFIRELRTRLSRPNRAVLLIAHVSKAAAYGRRSSAGAMEEDYSGSTAWHNSVRSRLSIDIDGNGVITIKHLKANNGPRAESIHLKWFQDAPVFEGGCDTPGAALTASLLKQAAEAKDASDKKAIVAIIDDFMNRGSLVRTATKGPYSTYNTLKIAPEFPEGMTSDRLNRLLLNLEREGQICRTTVRTTNRKNIDCFTTPAASDVSALTQPATTPTAPQ